MWQKNCAQQVTATNQTIFYPAAVQAHFVDVLDGHHVVDTPEIMVVGTCSIPGPSYHGNSTNRTFSKTLFWGGRVWKCRPARLHVNP